MFIYRSWVIKIIKHRIKNRILNMGMSLSTELENFGNTVLMPVIKNGGSK